MANLVVFVGVTPTPTETPTITSTPTPTATPTPVPADAIVLPPKPVLVKIKLPATSVTKNIKVAVRNGNLVGTIPDQARGHGLRRHCSRRLTSTTDHTEGRRTRSRWLRASRRRPLWL